MPFVARKWLACLVTSSGEYTPPPPAGRQRITWHTLFCQGWAFSLEWKDSQNRQTRHKTYNTLCNNSNGHSNLFQQKGKRKSLVASRVFCLEWSLTQFSCNLHHISQELSSTHWFAPSTHTKKKHPGTSADRFSWTSHERDLEIAVNTFLWLANHLPLFDHEFRFLWFFCFFCFCFGSPRHAQLTVQHHYKDPVIGQKECHE